MIAPEDLMRLAIDKAQQGIAAGQTPFGCAVAQDERVLAAAHNTVWLTTDITAHAEITALREACSHLGDVHIVGGIVATTCEPCPMCMAALHWANVKTVYYGAGIADAARAGFNELQLPAAEVLRLGRSQVKLVPGVLADECRQLFAEWESAEGHRAY